MVERYKDLNDEARKYLTKELKKEITKKFNSQDLLFRCEKEIEILYARNSLFLIEYLYKYKKENPHVKYQFKGTINNLLFLYVLNINYVNPLDYNLPYELFNDNNISIEIINEPSILFINYLDKQTDKFKLVHGFFVKEEIQDINDILANHYLLLPCHHLDNHLLLRFNDFNILETINDYREYLDKYITIQITEKSRINSKKVSLNNVFTNDFENKVAQILKPTSIDDYIKIKSIGHGTCVWNDNQDKLVQEKKITINNLIATREDILEYLINHQIERNQALEITNFIRRGQAKKNIAKWNEYVKLLKTSNCEDMIIEIFSKILFIFGRGQAVSECLYVLDQDNYA